MLQSGTTFVTPTIDVSAYDVRGDIDLDGDLDGTDKSLAQGAPISGSALGAGVLSDAGLKSRRGFTGYEALANLDAILVRRRPYSPTRGLWLLRDSIQLMDGSGV